MEILDSFLHIFKEWYWLPILLLYIGVISTILIENRNPSKTMAWIMVIVFLPIVGLLIYYFFGQKFSKVNRIKKSNHMQDIRMRKEWQHLEPYMKKDMVQIRERIGNLARVFTFLKNERLSSPTVGNYVKLLTNGEEKFPDFIMSLKNAKHSIHLEYYIFEVGNIGEQVLDILEEKATSGVIVRLLLDSIGSSSLVRVLRKKKDLKFFFSECMPVTFTSLANSNYRNHRKIAVIDGEIGYIGGINISDRYINDASSTNQVFWRDTSVRIEGPAINMLQISFWKSWNLTDGEPFQLEEGYLHSKPYQLKKGNADVSFVSSDPGSVGPYNMEAILIGIGEADKSIRLVTPYYIPSDELSTALKIAAAAGIDVELMLPEYSDSYVVQHASLSFIKPLLQRGVKVYFYKKGFIHAKTLTIDGKVSYIGTVNLDIRSFYINFEIAAIIADEDLCAQMEAQFEQDKRDSELMTLVEWKKRNVWKRGVDSLCRLLAPLL
ncbi:cardiolipin synthase [Sphingobacterium sp. UT-1RO-CII-1]|uniref:cardiolipin synthase n=1 Tax=Sphingobacterium sp. UT-1RO-CII-1 TaxID=2995225 RepID=UPI00227D2852|nr:cardiolipin synthase [Sphingobacterium sp. UT-1RO-CII-1]MCY4780699.1 cardiolipin synthase [Sphingobacterium sp. UT-1RO-CII-1]